MGPRLYVGGVSSQEVHDVLCKAALFPGVPFLEDLRALVARGYAPPYVLVGHSLGGGSMELFAKAHPEEVTGVVLVDPRHRDFTTACAEAGIEGSVPPPSIVAGEALWESMLGELAGEAADGEQLVFTGAGHYLQVERAHEVSQVILSIVTAARD